jgi:hypothetical protein
MDHRSFAALTRRASLTTLSAAGVAALAAPRAGVTKKKRKKKKFDVNKLCKQQVDQCATAAAVDCAGDPECIAATNLCCQELASCDFAGLFTCLEALAP